MNDEMIRRQLLAERWRLIGERLRERSPRAFQELLAMSLASALEEIDSGPVDIGQSYLTH